jgi:5-methylcytosine-specific restriction endonuclease McrA
MADYTPFGSAAQRHVDWSKHPSKLLGARWREIRNAVIGNHRGGCALCGGEEGPFEVDHIHPRSKGGGHEIANLQVLCRTCNRRKGNRG